LTMTSVDGSCVPSEKVVAALSRREVVAAASAALVLPLVGGGGPAWGDSSGLGNTTEAIATVFVCRRAMDPVKGYIAEGQWDRARSNVNYCTRVLRLNSVLKKVSNDIDEVEGLEIAGDLLNTMSDLDSSIYTPIFAFDTASGTQRSFAKYQKECYRYYDESVALLDRFIQLLPSELLAESSQLADARPLPKFLGIPQSAAAAGGKRGGK